MTCEDSLDILTIVMVARMVAGSDNSRRAQAGRDAVRLLIVSSALVVTGLASLALFATVLEP